MIVCILFLELYGMACYYRIPKSALVSFLASDYAFRIHKKSEIHTDIIERWVDNESAEADEITE